MPDLDSIISSSIYYASTGSEILKLPRTTSYGNAFVTLAFEKNEGTEK